MANRQRSESKERYWRGQVAGWAASGLGIRAYCQQERLSEANFHAWRRELARRDQGTPTLPSIQQPADTLAASKPATWLPITVAESACSDIEVQLPSGTLVRLPFSRETLEHLLMVLQRSVA